MPGTVLLPFCSVLSCITDRNQADSKKMTHKAITVIIAHQSQAMRCHLSGEDLESPPAVHAEIMPERTFSRQRLTLTINRPSRFPFNDTVKGFSCMLGKNGAGFSLQIVPKQPHQDAGTLALYAGRAAFRSEIRGLDF